MNLPINHPVAQTFLSAGLGDFPVAGSEDGNTGLESPVNPQVGKPALQLCGSLRFRSPVREILGGILLLLCAGPVARAHAHDPGLSSVAVTIQPERCDATLLFSKVDAAILLRSLAGSDETGNAKQIAAGLQPFAADSLALELDGNVVAAKAAHASADDSGNVQLCLSYSRGASASLSVRSKWLALLPPGHREFFSVQEPDGKPLASRLLSLNADSAALGLGGQPKNSETGRKSSFAGFLAMGVTHIWTGYDHLLFLFGLLAVTSRLRTVFKIITCFTVAHSITLAMAALNLVAIPSRVVEPLIAASIVFVGLENFLRNGEPKGRWLLTFAFGLIHGFGFASALRETGVGEHSGGVALPLVSFNLGIELGQIAIAALVLPLIWKLRNQPRLVRRWIPLTSTVVGALGTYWFIQRVV